jgi:hypothetical protein
MSADSKSASMADSSRLVVVSWKKSFIENAA